MTCKGRRALKITRAATPEGYDPSRYTDAIVTPDETAHDLVLADIPNKLRFATFVRGMFENYRLRVYSIPTDTV